MNLSKKRQKRIQRHRRVRARIFGRVERPRLSVFRSNKHIWAQLIDDVKGQTLVSASDLDVKPKTKTQKGKKTKTSVMEKKISFAEQLGGVVAERAQKKNISKVLFDRGGYKYHGLVKAIAEGARKGGLKF